MKKHNSIPIVFIFFSFLLAFSAALLCFLGHTLRERSLGYTGVSDTDEDVPERYCIVVDAGHGGEDGGAVANSGVLEKDLNLAVSEVLYNLLNLNDTRVVMTRTEDKMLYDKFENYEGRKKMYDLRARVETANEMKGAILVSIHMNSYPDPSCRGAQVYYSKNDGESYNVAGKIQSYLSLHLQKDNTRKIKAAGSNIYLLDKCECPAVLVECGFLSNAAETSMLCDAEYRKKLACSIFAALCDYLG